MPHVAQRLYESIFIVNASLDDPQIDAVIARVEDTITKNGGTIAASNRWGRKRLAYSINKKTTGFYVHLEFEGPSTLIAVLERAFQLDEMVLRHLTAIVDKRALKARKAQTIAEPPAEAAQVPTREPIFADKPAESAPEQKKEETP
jgi:small subunit ribosomal protein S6